MFRLHREWLSGSVLCVTSSTIDQWWSRRKGRIVTHPSHTQTQTQTQTSRERESFASCGNSRWLTKLIPKWTTTEILICLPYLCYSDHVHVQPDPYSTDWERITMNANSEREFDMPIFFSASWSSFHMYNVYLCNCKVFEKYRHRYLGIHIVRSNYCSKIPESKLLCFIQSAGFGEGKLHSCARHNIHHSSR
jgi:hypothetical protein